MVKNMRLNRIGIPMVIFVLLILAMSGCSSNGSKISPLDPGTTAPDFRSTSQADTNHTLLGLYTVILDPVTGMVEALPMRDAMMHLNALRFLEPPPPVKILISNISYDGEILDADIEFIHPFPGLDRYTGFDVNGIVISSGSISGFSDTDLVVSGEGDTRLINADGLTRWWNSREFPFNELTPIFGYIDGGKGTPDSIANYSSTLNGYKYHADGLSVWDDLEDLDISQRGAFIAGSGNSRHYTINMDGGFIFNYAVDACWFPTDDDPVIVPDSFPESANREEPWLIQTEVVSNTFYYNPMQSTSGGELGLQVTCNDWFHAADNTVRVESPGNFDPVTVPVPTIASSQAAIYDVSIVSPDLYSAEPITIWVSAEAGMDYDGLLPGKPTSAYAIPFEVEVEIQTQSDELVLVWEDQNLIEHGSRVPYNDIEPALVVNGDDDVLLSFSWWSEFDDHLTNYMRYASSVDFGMTFGNAIESGWHSHGGPLSLGVVFNNKYTVAANGWAFHHYYAPCGHTTSNTPDFDPHEEARSHSGARIENAGEMMYTHEGYPMQFGDQGGTILMRRGDYPNQGGTGDWPTFAGTEYVIVAEALLNYLSVSRSTGKTSDGRNHLIFWHSPTTPYIRLVSADPSGTSWDWPIVVFEGIDDQWSGAYNPSLWIDGDDGFHTLFAAETYAGEYHLMYGYSGNGADWDETGSFTDIMTVPLADGMNDTQVVVFEAYDFTWVFLSYETDGNIYCMYKKIGDGDFSDPILVSDTLNSGVPDVYPNGDTGLVFAWQGDDGSGDDLTDIFYRTAWFDER